MMVTTGLWWRQKLLRLTLTFVLCAAAVQGQNNPWLIREALKYEGQRIVSIAFSSEERPLDPKTLTARLPFQVGSSFHEEQLRGAIQSLYATGNFTTVAVDAAEATGGVALRFVTTPAYFIGHIAINGVNAPPNRGQLFGAAKLRLGAPFEASDTENAVASMRDLLQQNGYYQATIVPDVQRDSRTQSVTFDFQIEAGKRAHFEWPRISGDPERSVNKIVQATRWRRLYGLLGWEPVTEARVRAGVDDVRRGYEKRNLLQAQVTLERREYHADTNTVQPVLHINAGSRIVVRLRGASLPTNRLHQLIPVFQERALDPDLIIEGQRNLEQYLQANGYFGAEVSYSVENRVFDRTATVLYTISRGQRHKFVFLGVTGNSYFSAQTIRERLVESPAEFPRNPRGRFSNQDLRQDIGIIQALYASNGFRDAKVSSSVVDDYQGKRGNVAVFLRIAEGSQSFVSQLKVQGISDGDMRSIRDMLASLQGQPFSETNVALDRDNILNYYYDRGYLNASFSYTVQPAPDPQHVSMTYRVETGDRKFVRDIIVTGIQTTRPNLVLRRIELKRGQPLSLSAETDSQRRLYNLGIFARVNTALQNPEGDEDSKTVLYDIDEAKHYALNVGVGAQIARIGGGVTTLDNPAGTTGFAPRLAVGLTRENFLGLGQSIGVQSAISTIEQRAAITYFVPQLVQNPNLSFTTVLSIDNSNDVRTYTADRREASIQVGEKLSRAYTAQYRLVLRNVTLSNLKINQLLVPLLSQPETVGLAEVSLIEDKRDDPTDAHRGTYTTIDLAYAPQALGSQTQFGRALVRNSTYYRLARDIVLARSTQFGFISRTGGRANIPLAERLYSGGSTSIRAFPDFQAGPRDSVTGFPLGGNALFINNTELRFPLYGDNLGGVLFHDLGNVYTSLGNFDLRFRQPNLQDFNYTVQDIGFGIRYRTPIGPVRVDLSVSPDAPRFFGLRGTLQDYLNGTAISTVQKINAFQFHLSLGQAF